MKTELYQIISYNPLLNICDVAPASQGAAGILRAVPLGCFWGGSRADQVRHSPPLPKTVDSAQWGRATGGPRWGVTFPVQPGDYCQVGFLGGDRSSAIIVGLLPGWRGGYGPAYVGQRFGESPTDRFDILLPSGGWARCLADGSWVFQAAPAGQGAAIRVGSDGAVAINASSITLNGAVAINGSATINGKGIMVTGGIDSRGDTMVATGQ